MQNHNIIIIVPVAVSRPKYLIKIVNIVNIQVVIIMALRSYQQGTVKDRVLKCEVSLKAAEETIRQQGEVITVLREENKRLVSELQAFKGEIQSKVKGHVEKIKEDLQFKHAFIVVQNKQLQNQVIAQKAQKAALVTQIEGLDHRMAALEDAVGTD